MEPIHAELLRLATELEAVRGQVRTESNALRDLFAWTTTALSSSGSQHDRRLKHREAGRHLPQQLGGSRLDYGDFAFRIEGHAAVLSRDGQGGALLREVAKLESLKTTRLREDLLGCPKSECSYDSTRGKVATLVRRIFSVFPLRWTSSLFRGHALVQSQISGGTSGVDGEAHIAKAHQERE